MENRKRRNKYTILPKHREKVIEFHCGLGVRKSAMAPLLRLIALLCLVTDAIAACTTKGKRRAWYASLSLGPHMDYSWKLHRKTERVTGILSAMPKSRNTSTLSFALCKNPQSSTFQAAKRDLMSCRRCISSKRMRRTLWYVLPTAAIYSPLTLVIGRFSPLPPPSHESPRTSPSDRMQLYGLPTVHTRSPQIQIVLNLFIATGKSNSMPANSALPCFSTPSLASVATGPAEETASPPVRSLTIPTGWARAI